MISIDTLTNLVSGIDTEIHFNNRNQIGDLLKRLKACAIRYTSRGLETAIVSNACYALWQNRYISKYDKPPLIPTRDLNELDAEGAKGFIDDFCESVGQPYIGVVLIKDPMKKGGYRLEVTPRSHRANKDSQELN